MIKIIKLPEVKEATGLSRSAIYAYIKRGIFPQSVTLGPRAVGWVEAEIQEWLEARIAESRNFTDDE